MELGPAELDPVLLGQCRSSRLCGIRGISLKRRRAAVDSAQVLSDVSARLRISNSAISPQAHWSDKRLQRLDLAAIKGALCAIRWTSQLATLKSHYRVQPAGIEDDNCHKS